MEIKLFIHHFSSHFQLLFVFLEFYTERWHKIRADEIQISILPTFLSIQKSDINSHRNCAINCTLEEKIESFWPKKLSHWWNANWLSISSQFDSNILQQLLLGIQGRVLVPPVTQFFRSKWLHFFFHCCSQSERNKKKFYGTEEQSDAQANFQNTILKSIPMTRLINEYFPCKMKQNYCICSFFMVALFN